VTKSDQINVAVLDALGIGTSGQNILGVTLRIRHNRLPTVIVHRVLLAPGAPPSDVTERFQLTPLQKSPTRKHSE